MNKLFVLILVSTVCYGQQDKVKGKLSSKDTADLTILKIAPANFPDVSVFWEGIYCKFEDWYVHQELVSADIINKIKQNDGLSHEEIKLILFKIQQNVF